MTHHVSVYQSAVAQQ